MARLEQGYDFNQEMRTWVSPSLIEANHILSLSQQELQAAIQQEMAQNPALELEHHTTCPKCNSVLEGTWCPTCRQSVEAPLTEQTLDSLDEWDTPSLTGVAADADDFDPMTIVAERQSPIDQLRADAHVSLHQADYPIAELIIDSLDERGFLTEPLDEIAEQAGATEQDVEEVLGIIQSVAPVGVGARNLAECLLLQAKYLRTQNVSIPEHFDDVVGNHLNDLGSHRFGHIQRTLGIESDHLEAIREFIRSQLNPFPLQSHAAQYWQAPSEDGHITPDVMIDLIDDHIVVSIADNRYFHLRTNRLYEQLANEFSRTVKKSDQQPDRKDNEAPETDNADVPPSDDIESETNLSEIDLASASSEDKTHVRRYTQRAQMFMHNIDQRRTTLLRISECICRFQEGFLRGGVRELRPLTRALVAQEVGVHESTVSRATANKFVQLPTRKVIPFSDFFTPSLSVKDVLKEIIDRETAAGETLTDKRIVELLQDEGIRIARRTVAKYRAELGILPSTMR